MDGYSYIDIFDTKGIEYIVIISFLLLLIPFSIYIEKKATMAGELRKAIAYASDKLWALRKGAYYSKQHTWAQLDGTGLAKIGINGLLAGITGDSRIIPLRYSSEMIRKGDVLAELGSNGKRLRVYSPVSGQVLKINPELESRQSDLPNLEWICEIKPVNWKEETGSYFLAEEAIPWLRAEFERIRDFLAEKSAQHSPGLSMVVLQDGGEFAPGALDHLPAETWRAFQLEFLDPEESTGQDII